MNLGFVADEIRRLDAALLELRVCRALLADHIAQIERRYGALPP